MGLDESISSSPMSNIGMPCSLSTCSAESSFVWKPTRQVWNTFKIGSCWEIWECLRSVGKHRNFSEQWKQQNVAPSEIYIMEVLQMFIRRTSITELCWTVGALYPHVVQVTPLILNAFSNAWRFWKLDFERIAKLAKIGKKEGRNQKMFVGSIRQKFS